MSSPATNTTLFVALDCERGAYSQFAERERAEAWANGFREERPDIRSFVACFNDGTDLLPEPQRNIRLRFEVRDSVTVLGRFMTRSMAEGLAAAYRGRCTIHDNQVPKTTAYVVVGPVDDRCACTANIECADDIVHYENAKRRPGNKVVVRRVVLNELSD